MADTLLDLTQEILAEMGSDAVNSISDTQEATDVATIIRGVFKDIVSEFDIPGNANLIAFEGYGDTTKPTHMKMPADVVRIEWIKYDTRTDFTTNKRYSDVTFKEPFEFITITNQRASTDTDTYQVVQYTANVPIVIGRRAPPKYWTSFNDDILVFDSFDSTVDATLQASKTIAHGYTRPTLVLSDTAVPPLPENLMRQLYHQSLSKCFVDLKTVVNPKAERNENRSRIRNARAKWRQGRKVTNGPNYGR
jgi:hypothetical protein